MNFSGIRTSLTANDQLYIRQQGNHGMVGMKLYSLYMVQLLVPTDRDNLLPVGSVRIDTDTPSRRSMQIAMQTLYSPNYVYNELTKTLDLVSFDPHVFKVLRTEFTLQNATLRGSNGKVSIVVQIFDPSSCNTASTVPAPDTVLYTKLTPTAVPFVSFTLSSANCQNVTATPLSSFGYNHSPWILLTFDVVNLSTLDGITFTIQSLV